MTSTSQIIIQKVASGYIVTAPFQPTIINQDDIFRKQARILKDEFHTDSMLKSLQEPQNENEDSAEFKIESMPNVFIFKTLDELISFFKTYL